MSRDEVAMAWHEQLKSGRYRGCYRDAKGHKRYLAGTFTQPAEAKRRAAIEEDKQRQRGSVDSRAGKMTFGEWTKDHWWPTRKVEPGTQGRDESRLNVHILPYWQSTELGEILREDVQEWVNHLAALKDEDDQPALAPATVARIYAVFSAGIKAAVIARKIGASPCMSIDLPVIPPADEYYLTREEFARLRGCAPTAKDEVFLELKVGTGMRWGEIVALHRHRVFTAQKRIDVVEVFDNQTGEIKPYPKGRRKRGVPITADLAERLDWWFSTTPLVPCITPHRKVGGRTHVCRSGLVVPNSRGRVLNYSNWKRDVWGPATTGARLPDVTPHDLRHTYASWILQDGVSIEALSKLLGHSSVTVTERYSHLADTQWGAVRAALEGTPKRSADQSIKIAEKPAIEQTGGKVAPDLPQIAEPATGAKIIDLASRRRPAG